MLSHKRQRLGFYSFLIDICFGVILLFLTFAFLHLFSKTWEWFLQTITGYPFDIETVYHLQGENWLFVIILALLFFALQLSGFYRYDHHSRRREVLAAAIKGIIFGLALITLCFFFLNLTYVNRSLIFLFTILFSTYLFFKTMLWYRFLLYREQKGDPLELVFVGSVKLMEKTIQDFETYFNRGFRIKGIIPLEADCHKLAGISKLGNWNEISDVLTREPFDAVCYFPSDNSDRAPELLRVIEETGIELWYFLPEMFSRISVPRQDYFLNHPLLLVSSTSHYDTYFFMKRTIDVIVSVGLLFVLSPLLILIAALVKLTSHGPVFFKQIRTGFKGRPFTIYKFRTMVFDSATKPNSAKNTIKGPVYKADNDPRITPLGKWMRRFSLDELPQLWNVLEGSMSLVGPRPLPVEETRAFEAFRDHRRYRVLPGITGLWQVSGRASITEFEEWIRLDLEYIDQWSLWLDLKIIFKTIPAVLSGKGAK